jgi:hypothetical protein
MFESGWLSRLHKPGENPQINEKLKAEHLKTTGGKVLTRFPPEPCAFSCFRYSMDKRDRSLIESYSFIVTATSTSDTPKPSQSTSAMLLITAATPTFE